MNSTNLKLDEIISIKIFYYKVKAQDLLLSAELTSILVIAVFARTLLKVVIKRDIFSPFVFGS